jgi:DsbC/DsbD-like thiol-disulfide interchange protein
MVVKMHQHRARRGHDWRRGAVVVALAGFVVAGAMTVAHAQLQRPKAELTPVVEGDVRAGASVRATLKVTLPENVHVQSNKPRDPLLIPTVLTIEPPAGVTVGTIVYPAASDLKQEGQKQPLAVFGHEFTVTVTFTVAKGQAPGALVVPAKFKYQACDESLCYPPAKADLQWTLNVVATDE